MALQKIKRYSWPSKKIEYCDLDPTLPVDVKEMYVALITGTAPNMYSKFALKWDGSYLKVWMVRRLLVERVQLDLNEELAITDQLLRNDTISYHKWYHRRWVAKKIGTDAKNNELEFADQMIHWELYNFAAWSHRQWVLQEFVGQHERELEYCTKIIEEDSHCGYAWDQRYFVVTSIVKGLELHRDKEVDYALGVIAAVPESECPWAYIRKLYSNDSLLLANNRRIEDTCVSILENERKKAVKLNEVAVINIGACFNALDMIGHLIIYGLEPSAKLVAAVINMRQLGEEFAVTVCSSFQFARCDVTKLHSMLENVQLAELAKNLLPFLDANPKSSQTYASDDHMKGDDDESDDVMEGDDDESDDVMEGDDDKSDASGK